MDNAAETAKARGKAQSNINVHALVETHDIGAVACIAQRQFRGLGDIFAIGDAGIGQPLAPDDDGAFVDFGHMPSGLRRDRQIKNQLIRIFGRALPLDRLGARKDHAAADLIAQQIDKGGRPRPATGQGLREYETGRERVAIVILDKIKRRVRIGLGRLRVQIAQQKVGAVAQVHRQCRARRHGGQRHGVITGTGIDPRHALGRDHDIIAVARQDLRDRARHEIKAFKPRRLVPRQVHLDIGACVHPGVIKDRAGGMRDRQLFDSIGPQADPGKIQIQDDIIARARHARCRRHRRTQHEAVSLIPAGQGVDTPHLSGAAKLLPNIAKVGIGCRGILVDVVGDHGQGRFGTP